MAAADLDVEAILARAVESHRDARLDEAESGYRQILACVTNHADASNGLAVLMWQRGRIEQALELVARAESAAPEVARYSQTHGLIASSAHRDADALAAFERVCALCPGSQDGWLGMAGALQALRRFGAAVSAYRRARALGPLGIETLNNFGLALEADGQREEAIGLYREGLAQRADFVLLHNNLGNALLGIRAFDEALAVFRQGLALDAGNGLLWFNYGNALAARNAGEDAVDAYRRALGIDPGNAKAWANLANVLRARGELPAAIQCCESALALDPAFHDAHNNLGVCLLALGLLDRAFEALQQAIECNPESSVAHNNLGNALKEAGRIDEALAAFRRAMQLAPGDTQPHSNFLYSLYFHPEYDERAILREARRWAAAHAKPAKRRRPRRGLDPGRRLNIGYLSPDFRSHCQSWFTLPLLAHHDHARFKIHCYAQLAAPDSISERIRTHAQVWRPIAGLTDAEVDERIREDRIDILVDLTMHMANGRPLVFARKPAPVQIAWLAYPGTTGQRAIDYRLTDAWLDPPERGDRRYVERSIRLPHTFWCYDPMSEEPAVGGLPAVINGHVTFGCLNNFCKISAGTIDLWARVMARVPASRLILMSAQGAHRQALLNRLQALGVAPDRIEFVTFRPRDEYLATYRRIDICLDTLPYNGHTTSLDACWMGVPVVTRVGDTVVGRAGWSQLNNLGLPQLAGFDDAGFVEKAVALSADLSALAELRSGLRSRMQASPLMDAPAFAAAIEAVYRQVRRLP